MLDWLFAPPFDRRLLPGGRFSGPTPWVIAIMTFAMLIVAAAALALSNAAGVVAKGVERRYVVQIPAGAAALPRAVATLRGSGQVSNVVAVPETEMRRTLERWLGPAGAAADLPVPALIHFDAAGGADIAQLGRKLAAAVPGARIDAHEEAVGPLLRSMRWLQVLAWSLVLLIGLATSATVVLAARGALDTNRATIDVMHGIGATDVQVTHLFQRKIALDALVGAVAGGAGAAVVLLLLIAGGAALTGDLAGVPPLDFVDLVVLLLLPAVIVVLATLVARAAVLATLRRSI